MNRLLDLAIDVALDVLLPPPHGRRLRSKGADELSASEEAQAEQNGQYLVYKGRHSLRKAEVLIGNARRDLARGEHLLAKGRRRPHRVKAGLQDTHVRAEPEETYPSKSH